MSRGSEIALKRLNNHLTAKRQAAGGEDALLPSVSVMRRKSGMQIRKAGKFVTACAAIAGLALSAMAAVTPDGIEYPIADPLAGDQIFADLALGPNGGYLVWQDNVGDGSGSAV